jgi:hypothetical protein
MISIQRGQSVILTDNLSNLTILVSGCEPRIAYCRSVFVSPLH